MRRGAMSILEEIHAQSPRLIFRFIDGVLHFEVAVWREAPGRDDSHVEGNSHWIYSDPKPVHSIHVEEGAIEKIIELSEAEDPE
jgi:hypothetical protein